MHFRFTPVDLRLDPTLLEPGLVSSQDLYLLLLAEVGGHLLACGPETQALLQTLLALGNLEWDLQEGLVAFRQALERDARSAAQN